MTPESAFAALCLLLFTAWALCVVIDEGGK